MYLLIDIGNTFIKFAIYNNNNNNNNNYNYNFFHLFNLSSNKLLTKKQLYNKLNNKLKKYNISINIFKLINLCSVNPIWDNLIINIAADLKIKLYQLKYNYINNDIIFNIQNPNTLGADLIALSYGAISKYNNDDIIIICLGTTTTISMIKKRKYIGAVIMPGLKIISEALFKNTKLIKKFNYKINKKIIGKNTQQAVNLGIITGHVFSIQSFINKISFHLSKPKIIITGGMGKKIQYFFSNYIFDYDLLFLGMIYLLKKYKN